MKAPIKQWLDGNTPLRISVHVEVRNVYFEVSRAIAVERARAVFEWALVTARRAMQPFRIVISARAPNLWINLAFLRLHFGCD